MSTGMETRSRGATALADPFAPLRELPPLPEEWR